MTTYILYIHIIYTHIYYIQYTYMCIYHILYITYIITYIHTYVLYIHTYIYTSPEVHQRGHFLERSLTYLWEEDSIFSLNGSLPMHEGNNLDPQDCRPRKVFVCCLCVGHRAVQAGPHGGRPHSVLECSDYLPLTLILRGTNYPYLYPSSEAERLRQTGELWGLPTTAAVSWCLCLCSGQRRPDCPPVQTAPQAMMSRD